MSGNAKYIRCRIIRFGKGKINRFTVYVGRRYLFETSLSFSGESSSG